MKRKAMVCLLCLLLLLPAACADTRSGQNGQVQESGYEQISQEEAKELMDTREDALVLDVRTEAEYEEAHIPGAVCVPNESIQDTMPEELPQRKQEQAGSRKTGKSGIYQCDGVRRHQHMAL